ncbi:hypothetical protein BN7_3941 [Wickerhamomyces ciferrii]|uniref:Uncharacterized protein n=1 Tax=Wickerhamomyces ciferrii (strain ATCC 14091 / BCRC 22168 / CBS 111 / JCM 3599 / NBRC 0793 / NRRL Y-1031 F-60-10) TaxID=1206466 RepID=K0KSS6_WICCF|nr:uncharacterized protein BN7_3941 [Wickerhamomyces ciferrii]CCH44378.1 hypothetical protein BN7_3941 [Wickerhamomyces ciferrii]
MPHQAMTVLDGFEDLQFDLYDTEKVRATQLIQYSFVYVMVNPRLESFTECFENVPSTLMKCFNLKIQVFNKSLVELASVRTGVSHQEVKLYDTNHVHQLFPSVKALEWNNFSFNNHKIPESNIKTLSSQNLRVMKIQLCTYGDAKEYYGFENFSFPNLKHLRIQVREYPKDSLVELKNNEYRFYHDDQYKGLFIPKKQFFKLSFKSCKFPLLNYFTLSSNAKIECISNCEFPKLERLQFNNNFLLLIEDTNFELLKNLVINPTINLMKVNHSSAGLLKEDQFDIRGLSGMVKKFCDMHGVAKSKIKCFPSFIVNNVKLDSLETLQVPHSNSLLGFDDGFLSGKSIEPIIHPDPPTGYVVTPRANEKRKTTSNSSSSNP